MERNLLKYIWRHSKPDQIWMLGIILLSMPTYFLSLELPKRIVNSPIQGVGFENPGDVGLFLKTNLPFGDWFSDEPITLFGGFELERIGYLIALAVSFLVLVVANGLFKLYINTYKGRMGERILRRLRFELFDRVLRFPLTRFRRTRPSEISSMIKDEVEPMGEYIGDAFTQPLFLGGQAAVALLFIFLQHFWLGVATFVVIMFQAWLIPRLRRRLIVLGKQRQIISRQLSGRLGEIVEGIQEAHTNDTSNYERSNIAHILGRLFFIRFELYQRKFSVKFINNLLIQFLAFFFYAVGGYLAIRGSLDIGQLIGVIIAYKDLPAPVRGLIDYDQKRLVVETRYGQVIEQFVGDDMLDPLMQSIPQNEVPRIEKGYEISRLGLEDETGLKLLENTSTDISITEKIAVVGSFGSGASEFAEVLAGIAKPTSGKVLLDDNPIEEQPEYLTGRRIAYIDGGTFFPQETIMNILTYVLKHQPLEDAQRERAEAAEYQSRLTETRRAGNIELDYAADWIEYDRHAVMNLEALTEKIRDVLQDVKMEDDVRALGLRGTVDPENYPQLCTELVEARRIFRERLDDLGFSEFVESFDPEKYNSQSSIGENLLFGTAIAPEFQLDQLPSNLLVRTVLQEEKLEDTLFSMGKEVAATTIELFGDLSPDDPFFNQLNYMDADDLPEYRSVLARIGDHSITDIEAADRLLIMRLPFSYTEDRNRLGLLDEALKSKILGARKILHTRMMELPDMPVARFEPDSYNPAASVLDNVLLGRVSQTVAEGDERVTAAIRDLLEEMNLTDEIFRIGLTYNVGSGGKRLSETQRQKLHLARALLKKPDMLIANRAMNNLSAREQGEIIQTVLDKYTDYGDQKAGAIWIPVNPAFSELFDRVLVFDNGELVADGTPADLKKSNPVYQELIS